MLILLNLKIGCLNNQINLQTLNFKLLNLITLNQQKNMKKSTKIIMLFAIVGTLFTNCKKTEVGPKGEPGTPGNANVKSTIITVQPSNFYYTGNGIQANVDINYASITQDIVDKGAVMVYIYTASNTWAALPATFFNTNYQTLYDYTYTASKVTVSVSFSNLAPIIVNQPITFKIVAIAGSNYIKPLTPTAVYENSNTLICQ